MPNLNKRKHRFKDKIRNVKEAERFLRENKNKKFQQSSGKNWKYGHLTTAQALGPADKFMEKTIGKVMNTGKPNENITSSKRHLGKFEKDMTARFKQRPKKRDPIWTQVILKFSFELSGNEMLDEIDENDDIFMFRDKNENASSYDSKEDLLESSGDDLDNNNDNSVPFTQLEENNAKDIDTIMQEEEDEEDVDSSFSRLLFCFVR
ncbi:hypothetical protein RFI_16688 [Reticulomyxa filosa]|uniref:Uncharacterized protein n=1 Tax=Reticulomyxa filosa TaxID=46433 RepID=X6N3P0_RETFI|nr:hypothetical protein RFI_16688 [Reticulomyxa filosa]|eukprot:ETO20528.1 hypothetical protein RFI_16688 [Reticulomyxa filosa]